MFSAGRGRRGFVPVRRVALAFIAALLAVLVCGMVWAGMVWLDPWAYARAGGLDPELRRIARILTHVGQSGWILVASGLAVLTLLWSARRSRRTRERIARLHAAAIPGFVFLSVAASGIAAQIIKTLIGRARPRHFDALGPLAFHPLALRSDFASFPSGHTTTLFAFAGALACLLAAWPRSRPDGRSDGRASLSARVLIALFFALAAAGALTRILVGAHYATDVIAGAVLGALLPFLLSRQMARRRWLFEKIAGPPASGAPVWGQSVWGLSIWGIPPLRAQSTLASLWSRRRGRGRSDAA